MDPHLTCALVSLYGDIRVLQSNVATILKEYKMAIDPTTESKLQELEQSIVNEGEELKGMITGGADPTEINARLDSLISAVKNISEVARGA